MLHELTKFIQNSINPDHQNIATSINEYAGFNAIVLTRIRDGSTYGQHLVEVVIDHTDTIDIYPHPTCRVRNSPTMLKLVRPTPKCPCLDIQDKQIILADPQFTQKLNQILNEIIDQLSKD